MTESTVANVRLWCYVVNLLVWVAVEVALSIAGAWRTPMRSFVMMLLGVIAGGAIPLIWRAWKHLHKHPSASRNGPSQRS